MTLHEKKIKHHDNIRDDSYDRNNSKEKKNRTTNAPVQLAANLPLRGPRGPLGTGRLRASRYIHLMT